MTTRDLPAPIDGHRVETGPVRFANDWTGTFFRGDDCIGYSLYLEQAIEEFERLMAAEPGIERINVMAVAGCKGLLALLRQSSELPSGRDST